MNSSTITIKVQPQLKLKAKKIAQELGFDLHALVKNFLTHIVHTKTIPTSVLEEIPNAYMRKALKESKADDKAGRGSPPFKTAEDAVKWLRNPNRKYANQIR